MILKKRKKIISCALAFLLVFAFFFSFLFFPLRKRGDSVDAAGFGDLGQRLSNYTVSAEIVLTDTTSQSISVSSSQIDNPVYSNIFVQNGFSVPRLLSLLPVYGNFDLIQDIYVAVSFENGLDTTLYDFFLSDNEVIRSYNAFDMQNRALTTTWEYFIPPMPIGKMYKANLSSDNSFAPVVKSFAFRYYTAFFRDTFTSFVNYWFDYYIFVYSKTDFVDYNTAYNQGYDNGLSYGQESGFNNGYNVGYQAGVTAGLNEGNTFFTLISAVIDVPVQSFFALLSFEILGVNVANFVLSLLTLALIIFILKKVL